MSEQDNVNRVQQIYADFGEGNIVGVLESLTDDVMWVEPEAGNSPVAGVARGRDEGARFFRVLDDVSEAEAFEPREFVAQGDKVVVLGYYRFRVRASGKRWESEWAMVWTFRDGQVAHFQFYGDGVRLTDARDRRGHSHQVHPFRAGTHSADMRLLVRARRVGSDEEYRVDSPTVASYANLTPIYLLGFQPCE